jgi:hypothetical protein
LSKQSLCRWRWRRCISILLRQALMPLIGRSARRLDTESDDATRVDVHHDHRPEVLQKDRFAAKQIDAPLAVTGSSDDSESRRTTTCRLGEKVVRQNPAHHILIDLQTEGLRNLLGNARSAEAGIEALDLDDCGNAFGGFIGDRSVAEVVADDRTMQAKPRDRRVRADAGE